MRLDQILVKNGAFASRSRARDAIRRGCVLVEDKIITKAGYETSPDTVIEVRDPARQLVSRAGLKLLAALDHFAIEVKDRICLDIGVSTGGFSQVLLDRGAAHIIAIDVGHGQLHPSLVDDKRITLHEGLNARQLERHHLEPYHPSLLVCDVSFISLKLALPAALALMGRQTEAVLPEAVVLVKPQFEAGRAALNAQGIVKDKRVSRQIAQELHDWLDTIAGWRCCGLMAAPICGGDGNQEFLLYAIRA